MTKKDSNKSDWVVNDNIVKSVRLVQPYEWFKRHDVLPFMIAYAVCIPLSLLEGTEFLGLVATPCVLIAHLALFLLAQVSPNIRCSLGNRIITNISEATSVMVSAQTNAGKDRVCKLVHDLNVDNCNEEELIVAGISFPHTTRHFEFQNVKYEFDNEKNAFAQVVYPTASTVGDFCSHTGYKTGDGVEAALHKWGRNEFEIPMPEFVDLYLENLVAPFFIFQILCLLLWSLDDYWYYSLFTMLMLFFFEALMANQRLAGLQTLRAMRRPPVHIFTFRGNRWQQLLSDELVPGDIISISSASAATATSTSTEEEKAIPCDVLLIRGSCVANEAMLTGESVPQVKESLRSLFGDDDEDKEGVYGEGTRILQRGVDLGPGGNSNRDWDRHVLFSGTVISQHTETLPEEERLMSAGKSGGGSKGSVLGFSVPRAPDKGSHGIVMRTSFGTCQGGLMRTILYSAERVTTSSSSFETFLFIGMLLVFALVASGVVLQGGIYDENRNKFKLVLHCIMIITSVVPPELPMELSLAVTTSLAALVKNHIYCTEAYRINFAGKVSMLCFDKTGTLTQDKMVLRGMVDPQDVMFDGVSGSSFTSEKKLSSPQESAVDAELDEVTGPVKLLLDPDECADLVLTAMAACQSLLASKHGGAAGELLGDPLEVETFRQSEFTLGPGGAPGLVTSVVHAQRGISVSIQKRYPFSSALKRMSVVAGVTSNRHGKHQIVCCKGAPEVLQKFLTHIPANYVATYELHMALGRRVIALAYKSLPDAQGVGVAGSKSRASVECDLTFLSFLVFDSSLKSDTKSVMKDLRHTGIPMMMITGDSPFTAADIGQKLYITKKDKPSLVLDASGDGDNASSVVWRRALSASEQLLGKGGDCDEGEEQERGIPLDLQALPALKVKHNLIVTGGALLALQTQQHQLELSVPTLQSSQMQSQESVSTTLLALSSHVQIFARTSPQQKEQVLWALNKAGFITLMCGDGTNDVGALKAAHVGISVINNAELEGKLDKMHARMKKEEKKKGKKEGPSGGSGKSKDRVMRAMLEQQTMDPTVVKFGDASIASPFTARRTSVDSVLTVLRQGRCTLVTTIQVYKILALNCLVSAYLMSSLYLMGLKQGDSQMTALGLITACMFFCISQAKPLPKLSGFSPASSVFQAPVLCSILGQFIVHFACLFAVLQLCQSHQAVSPVDMVGAVEQGSGSSWTQVVKPVADSRFNPDVINTAMFLLSGTISMNNFIVNYRGHPFSESIRENKLLFRASCGVYGALLVLVLEVFEPLSDLMQLVPLPSVEFQYILGGLLVLDLVACWAVEALCQFFERRGRV